MTGADVAELRARAGTDALHPDPEPTEPMFDVEPTVPAAPRSSKGTRRTARQRAAAAEGRNPLALVFGAGVQRHPDATPVTGPDDDTVGPRCGACTWRRPNDRGYPKCTVGDYCRATGSEATDVRAWWPACDDFAQRGKVPHPDFDPDPAAT